MSSMTYRPDIDGLRAIAVLAVVINHLSPDVLPGGYVGVDIFFVISGYLITKIINREISEGTFTYTNFYERRARRIFPALFAVLTATFILGYLLLLPSDLESTLKATIGAVFFSSNLIFWREMKQGYFAATDTGLNPLLHTWSLAVEEQFYVFFPILLLLCTKHFKKHTKNILILTAIISLATAASLIKSKSVAVFFLSPFRIWELLIGSILAINAIPPITNRGFREIIAFFGLFLILAAYFLYSHQTTFPGIAALVPVLGAAALIHSGSSGASFFSDLLRLRPVVFIGLISYSLYLWHWPLIVFAKYYLGAAPVGNIFFAIFSASIVLGYLSYKFIEQPFRAKKREGDKTRILVFSVTGIITLTLASTWGLFHNGFPSRFTSVVIELDRARQPQIPFKRCDAKTENEWCRLGRSNVEPKVFLWGDSHLLSWAPALNEVLDEKGVAAIFATRSACPPLIGVTSATRPMCEPQNNGIKRYLAEHPEVDTVVMAGFWSFYFNTKNELTPTAPPDSKAERTPAQIALVSTIEWLRGHQKKVILIGPVPVFDRNVPLALALEQAREKNYLHSSLEQQMQLHSSFYDVVPLNQSEGDFIFLDPIEWLCKTNCRADEAGVPIYRDAHHLSVFGAMQLKSRLRNGLEEIGLQGTRALSSDSVN